MIDYKKETMEHILGIVGENIENIKSFNITEEASGITIDIKWSKWLSGKDRKGYRYECETYGV